MWLQAFVFSKPELFVMPQNQWPPISWSRNFHFAELQNKITFAVMQYQSAMDLITTGLLSAFLNRFMYEFHK